MGHLHTMYYHFKLPSAFFTYSLDDIHGVLNLRLGLSQHTNLDFSARDSGLREAMQSGASEFKSLKISPSGLKSLLALSPIAAAEIFRLVTDAVFSILLGVPPYHEKKNAVFHYHLYESRYICTEFSVQQSALLELWKHKVEDLCICTTCFGVTNLHM